MPIDQSVLARIDDYFRDRVTHGLTPSSCYAIFDRSEIVAYNGFGFIDNVTRRPTSRSIFRIASCTKSFTAAALLQLRESGAVSLDDRVTDWLDTGPWTLFDKHVEPPTLRMLLSMSGGLPTDDAWADRQESMSTDEFDRFVGMGFSLSAQPGIGFQYSNLGYALIGRVIEKATGTPYREYVTANLLQPLELAGIGFDKSVGNPDDLAIGFHRDGNAWQPLPLSSPGAFSPIGGLFATLETLSSWGRWLMAAFDSGVELPTVLSARSRREMQSIVVSPVVDLDAETINHSYGLGLTVEHDQACGVIISHSGGYPGYSSHMRWSPITGIGIVAFENATYSGAVIPARAALALLLSAKPAHHPALALWDRTLHARIAAERFLAGDATLLAPMLADNVGLDQSIECRAAEARKILDEIGPIPAMPPILPQCDPKSTAPSNVSWTIRGSRGAVRGEVTLTPQMPPQVQTLRFSVLPNTHPKE